MVTRLTYGNLIVSLRMYFEEQTGVTSLWRYPGYETPSERPFVAFEYVNSVYNTRTKLKELITQNVYMNAAIYANDVAELNDIQSQLDEILLYHTIPLRDMTGEVIGHFNVNEIVATATIPYGTKVEDETETIRSYTDFFVAIDHVKIRSI